MHSKCSSSSILNETSVHLVQDGEEFADDLHCVWMKPDLLLRFSQRGVNLISVAGLTLSSRETHFSRVLLQLPETPTSSQYI